MTSLFSRNRNVVRFLAIGLPSQLKSESDRKTSFAPQASRKPLGTSAFPNKRRTECRHRCQSDPLYTPSSLSLDRGRKCHLLLSPPARRESSDWQKSVSQ